MYKRIIIYSLLLISNLNILHASDSFNDVKASYDRAMAKWSRNNDKIDVEISEQDSKNLSASFIAEKLGVGSNSVMSIEQFMKDNQEFNSKLFHALNASIATVSLCLSKAHNDDSHEWTFRNGSLSVLDDQEKYSLEGVMQVYDESTHTIEFVAVKQLYEIERQKLCFDLTSFWNMFIFWKRCMFPNNTISSYNAVNTEALYSQITKLYEIRKRALKTTPLTDEQQQKECYVFMIVEMLAQIQQNMPAQFQLSVPLTKHFTPNQTIKKINKIKNDVHNKREQFDHAYDEFIGKNMVISRCLGEFQKNPIKLSQNKIFAQNLRTLYQDYLKFTFPGTRGRIRFSSAPLNFAKLMPDVEALDLTVHLTVELNMETSTSITNNQKPKEIVDEKSEEEVIHDDAYWEEQNRYHAARKGAVEDITENKLTIYEFDLFTYLNDKIYKYERRKARTLVQELRELKFNVIANSSGKGSLHYVYPAEDNPLFGSNPNYAEAYFNLHLPNKSEIVPSGYFDYAQSGFGRVFGLTLEYIQQKLHQ